MVRSSHNFSSDSRIDSFVRSAAPGCTHAEQIESRSSLQPCAVTTVQLFPEKRRTSSGAGIRISALKDRSRKRHTQNPEPSQKSTLRAIAPHIAERNQLPQ